MMNASTVFDTEVIGSLPILVAYLDRLKLAETIDKTVSWAGGVPLGTVVEVLVLNRLLNPEAMYRIDDWAQASGVAAYYGLKPNALNDDLLGRALERLHTHGDAAQAPLVLQAIREFDLDVSQIHYDMTSVEFYGAFEQPTADTPAAPDPVKNNPAPLPTYGRSKSGRLLYIADTKDGTVGAAETERQTDVRPVPRKPPESGADRSSDSALF